MPPTLKLILSQTLVFPQLRFFKICFTSNPYSITDHYHKTKPQAKASNHFFKNYGFSSEEDNSTRMVHHKDVYQILVQNLAIPALFKDTDR